MRIQAHYKWEKKEIHEKTTNIWQRDERINTFENSVHKSNQHHIRKTWVCGEDLFKVKTLYEKCNQIEIEIN